MSLPLPAAELALAGGWLSLSPLPGRDGALAADLAALRHWRADLLVSLVEAAELPPGYGPALAQSGLRGLALPIRDYGVPEGPDIENALPHLLARLRLGQRIALHCMGGCGRSGMIALRLMCLAGEPEAPALMRLRAVRPCAVETEAQRRWAVRRAGVAPPG